MYFSATTKQLSISLFMRFRIFNFGQTKITLCGDAVLMFVKYVTFCHTNIKIWNFTSETQLSNVLLSCMDRMLNYGL